MVTVAGGGVGAAGVAVEGGHPQETPEPVETPRPAEAQPVGQRGVGADPDPGGPLTTGPPVPAAVGRHEGLGARMSGPEGRGGSRAPLGDLPGEHHEGAADAGDPVQFAGVSGSTAAGLRLDARQGLEEAFNVARPAPKPLSVPPAVTRRTRSWRRVPATRMLAAADTIRSKLSGVWADARSSITHGGAALPRQLVLADHELVVAGGGGPVHPAQVVADDVGPQGEEVLAAPAEGVGVLGPGQGVVPGAQRHRRQRLDGRVDDQLGDAGGRQAQAGEPERVGELDLAAGRR